MNKNNETKKWERDAEQLSEEMELHMDLLVKQECGICNANGGKGYTEWPLTGKVCKHMEQKNYNKFKKKIEKEFQFIVENIIAK